jgi:hypothetical protein
VCKFTKDEKEFDGSHEPGPIPDLEEVLRKQQEPVGGKTVGQTPGVLPTKKEPPKQQEVSQVKKEVDPDFDVMMGVVDVSMLNEEQLKQMEIRKVYAERKKLYELGKKVKNYLEELKEKDLKLKNDHDEKKKNIILSAKLKLKSLVEQKQAAEQTAKDRLEEEELEELIGEDLMAYSQIQQEKGKGKGGKDQVVKGQPKVMEKPVKKDDKKVVGKGGKDKGEVSTEGAVESPKTEEEIVGERKSREGSCDRD